MAKIRISNEFDEVLTRAEATLIFSTLTNQTWFGAGGYSFVLEDALGNKVRFFYSAYSTPELGGYFDEDALQQTIFQPRYTNGIATYEFDENNPFFGYGWDDDPNGNRIVSTDVGTHVNIKYSDISSDLISHDINVVLSAVSTLVDRTVSAINYAQEVKITAERLTDSSIKLTQDSGGTEGNTLIFRGYSTGQNAEGSFFDTLTSQIQTIDFENGSVTRTLQQISKSGTLSNAIKKELNRRSFSLGKIPVTNDLNKLIFDDSLTRVFKTYQNVNSVLGVNLSLPDQNRSAEYNLRDSYIIEKDESVFDADTKIGLEKNRQLLLENTGIFDLPNSLGFSDFTKQKEITSKNVDYLLEEKKVYTEYTPYTENYSLFKYDDSDFINSSLKDEGDVKNKEQIKISLDFTGKDAFLVNTAIAYNNSNDNTDNIEYPNSFRLLDDQQLFGQPYVHKRISLNYFPTAYFNINDNSWEYLDSNLKNVNGINSDSGKHVFPKNFLSSISNESINQIENDLLNRPVCMSPAHRIDRSYLLMNEDTDYKPENAPFFANYKSLLHPTNSYGFPNKFNWQPHSNHMINMGNYIYDDFIVEKVIVKTKLSANFSRSIYDAMFPESSASTLWDLRDDQSIWKDWEDTGRRFYSNYDALGVSFFLLNNRKNNNKVYTKFFNDLSNYYFETRGSLNHIENNINNVITGLTERSETGLYLKVIQLESKNNELYNIDENIDNKLSYEKENKFIKLNNVFNANVRKFSFQPDYFLNPYAGVPGTYSFLNEDLNSGEVSYYIYDAYPNESIKQTNDLRELISVSNLLLTKDARTKNYGENICVDSIIDVTNENNSNYSLGLYEDIDVNIKTDVKVFHNNMYHDETFHHVLSNTDYTKIIEEGSPSRVKIDLDFDNFRQAIQNNLTQIGGNSFSFNKENFRNQIIDSNTKLAFYNEDFKFAFSFVESVDSENGETETVQNTSFLNPDGGQTTFNYSTNISMFFITEVIRQLNFKRIYSDANGDVETASFLVLFDFFEKIFKDIIINSIVDINGKKLKSSFSLLLETNNKTLKISLSSYQNGYVQSTDTSSTSEGAISISSVEIINGALDTTSDVHKRIYNNILEGKFIYNGNITEKFSERNIDTKSIEKISVAETDKYNNLNFQAGFLSGQTSDFKNIVNYSFFDDDSDINMNVVKTNYLLKPEDNITIGVSATGNGDLLPFLVRMHDKLDITLVGEYVHKRNKNESSESNAITKIIESQNIKDLFTQYTDYESNSYFNETYNRNIILNSSNKYLIENPNVTLKNFITLEQDYLNSGKTYYYDSVWPNLIDYFSFKNKKISPVSGQNKSIIYISDETILDSTISDQRLFVLFHEEINILDDIIKNDQMQLLRSINNSLTSSLFATNQINNTLQEVIDIFIDKDSFSSHNSLLSYEGEPFSQTKVTLYDYTKFNYKDVGNINFIRSPLKIQNNANNNFLFYDNQIIRDPDRENYYGTKVSIQELGSDHYLMIHDSSLNTILLEYYTKLFGNNYSSDFEIITQSNYFSKNKIEVRIEDYGIIDFQIYYGNINENMDQSQFESGDYTNTNFVFVHKLLGHEMRDFSTSQVLPDRSEIFGGDDTGISHPSQGVNFLFSVLSDTIYDDAIFNLEQLLNYNNENALLAYQTYFSNQPRLYLSEETITINGVDFTIESFFTVIKRFSIPRYKLLNPKSSQYPVMTSDISLINKPRTDLRIANNYYENIDIGFFEDEGKDYNTVKNEFNSFPDDSLNFKTNEKIYVCNCYYSLSNTFNNIEKTNAVMFFKYKNIKTNVLLPHIEILGIKTFNSILKSQKVFEDDCAFLPSTGFIRVYEEDILNQLKYSNLLKDEDVPYFEIDLSKIFKNEKCSLDPSSGNIVGGSKLFRIKRQGQLLNENNVIWETKKEMMKSINSILYGFDKKNNSFAINDLQGFKYGIKSLAKQTKTYKFNKYHYGQYSDFISYSENTAYIDENNIVSYPIVKSYYDQYFSRISAEETLNTYNTDIYCRSNYAFIEDNSNSLSQYYQEVISV